MIYISDIYHANPDDRCDVYRRTESCGLLYNVAPQTDLFVVFQSLFLFVFPMFNVTNKQLDYQQVLTSEIPETRRKSTTRT